MSKANLEQFYQDVLQDQALQEQFRTATDPDSMAALAVQLGQEKGYSFTTEEVQAYIDDQGQELSDELLEAIAGGARAGGESNIVYGGDNRNCS
ncbi:MAG: Nif11-like leader peptide family natural product precursor [Coleofasciculus sp. S288]|nr:Nif11-like leader peptide family natural product precursor [Coleofasciculus sp. S288]